jgi:hypothetical protein
LLDQRWKLLEAKKKSIDNPGDFRYGKCEYCFSRNSVDYLLMISELRNYFMKNLAEMIV